MRTFNVSHKPGIAAPYGPSIAITCYSEETAARLYVEDTFGRTLALVKTHNGDYQIKVPSRDSKGLQRMYVKVELDNTGAGRKA